MAQLALAAESAAILMPIPVRGVLAAYCREACDRDRPRADDGTPDRPARHAMALNPIAANRFVGCHDTGTWFQRESLRRAVQVIDSPLRR
jgi:hypothetical protein